MAVVQISRIQHRRGREGFGTGLPQLASGELGWAIDTRSLYIGNGAVSEGAPFVGNTKILTEADDLLDLAGQYAYRRGVIQTGVSIGSPIERTIQDKLDDVVSIRDFGVNGLSTEGDVSTQFQRAIDQLFINSATKGTYASRVTLHIPAGQYVLTQPLYIPPFANIQGDGKDKTFITSTAENFAIVTVNEDSVPGVYQRKDTATTLNQSREIRLSGFTLSYSGYFQPAILLEACRDSIFEDIKITGTWNSSLTPTSDYIGIRLDPKADSNVTSCNNNRFINVDIEGFAQAVTSDYDVFYNVWDTCNIDTCGYGFYLGVNAAGGVQQKYGPSYTTITNCTFDNIYNQGIYVENGKYNTSENNKFLNVGNHMGASNQAETSIIQFNDRNNVSVNDYFTRTTDLLMFKLPVDDPDAQDAGSVSNPNFLANPAGYFPEVGGYKNYLNNFTVYSPIGELSDYTPFFNIPADQDRGTIEVDYHYKCNLGSSDNVFRKGKITIVYNKDDGANPVSFSDEFLHTGDPTKASATQGLDFTTTYVGGTNNITINVRNRTPDAGSLDSDDEFVAKVKHIA